MPQLLDHRGQPITSAPRQRDSAHALAARQQRGRPAPVEARFDAATASPEFDNYWAAADHLDADSAHSPAVRRRLVSRSRYEVANNGYADGAIQTYCNYLIGSGPTLRLMTGSKRLDSQVPIEFWKWAKAARFRRQLWCLAHAKLQDGEGIALARINPRIRHPVQLDVVPIETEQCASPNLPHGKQGYVDGIKFDDFGNPLWYDILPHHPGGTWGGQPFAAEQVPARWVMHWFLLRRPGQHRAVPEFRSTLNTGASSRRWREATVSAAETAASQSLVLKSTLDPDEEDELEAMSTTEMHRRMMTILPTGYDPLQVKSEHPSAQYEQFHRAQINEQARPKSIPYNLAACDSSGYNFASAKLDSNSFHATLNTDRWDCDDLVLDTLFPLWWQLAVPIFGWDADPREVPDHEWGWPQYPVGDTKSAAATNDSRLRNGSASLSRIYEESGRSFEDDVIEMARDFGVPVEQMRQILLRTLFPVNPQTPAPGDSRQPGQTPEGGRATRPGKDEGGSAAGEDSDEDSEDTDTEEADGEETADE